MLSAGAYPSAAWAHRAFQTVVFWTVGMAVLWFGARIMDKAGK